MAGSVAVLSGLPSHQGLYRWDTDALQSPPLAHTRDRYR